MSDQDLTVVFDSSGQRGLADLVHLSTHEQASPQVLIKFEGQPAILVDRNLLSKQSDGSYILPWSVTGLIGQSVGATPVETLVIPVIEETVQVTKHQVETERLRIKKVVHEHQETVDVALLLEALDIERIPVNQIVTEAGGMRQEGDTLIIPVYEEVVVVQKQLLLKEEVHIRKQQLEQHQPEIVTLRKEELLIEHLNSS